MYVCECARARTLGTNAQVVTQDGELVQRVQLQQLPHALHPL